MSNDDSFNDSDELFSLYSSKKVTETFKAQLKKIVASNNHLANVSSHVNNEEIRSEKHKNSEEEIVVVSEKLTENSSLRTTPEKCEDVSVIGGCEEECSLEDSIEIINEVASKPTRQSKRLRKKRDGSASKKSFSIHSDPEIRRPANRRRNSKSRGKKRKEGNIVEEITLDDSPESPDIEDELNPEISVKVIWKSVNIKKFKVRKFQKLAYIYELLSKEEKLPEDRIILTFNNIKINRNDTPDSLNLQVYHFLDGGELSESSNLCHTSNTETCNGSDGDSVTLKFQDVNKKIVTLSINKNEKLKVGMIKCSEQLDVPLQKIKFFFDGDILQPSETPASLGLVNEEVIDIKITD